MMVGKPPFSHTNQNILFSRIKSSDFNFPHDVVDEDAKSLINQLLVSDVRLIITLESRKRDWELEELVR